MKRLLIFSIINNKKWSMHIFISVFFWLFLTFPCLAQDSGGPLQSYQCPNKVKCQQRLYSIAGSNSSEQTLGTIHVKCCYKLPTGCRPWHCEGDKTDMSYWQAKCNETFPDCQNNHAGFTDPFCTAHFETYF